MLYFTFLANKLSRKSKSKKYKSGTFSNQIQQITLLFDKLFISYKGDFMVDKKELTDALIREVKYLLRNENQTRESFNHLTLPERKC